MVQHSDLISGVEKYAFDEINKKVAELKAKGVKVIDFGVGDPTTPTPDYVIDNMTKFARNRAAAGYPSYAGEKEFRDACSRYIKRKFNVEIDPDKEVSSIIGSKEAIFHFPLGFINPGDTVICPTPSYPGYHLGTKFAYGVTHYVPLLEKNKFLIDIDAIPSEVAEKAKIIWTNYPNSPTGVQAPIEWLEKLVKWADKYNIIIAADEGCYNDIYFEEKPRSILEVSKKGIITFYSLSKRSNMTGYRVGFVAGDEAVVTGFKKVKTNVDSGTPFFIQDAAILALDDDSFSQKMTDEYAEKRNIMKQALHSVGLNDIYGDTTFYLWVKVPSGMTSLSFASLLTDMGIVVTPGEVIAKEANGSNPGKDFVRMALVATKEEVNEAAKRISESLKI